MSSTVERSNGFLPLQPLRHADPTAVGLWDMDRGPAITRPLQLPSHGARDQLVLVRLHGEPLTILHLEAAPGEERPDQLLEAVWHGASEELIAHVSTCGCLPVPEGVDDLAALLETGGRATPRQTPPRPRGRAAAIVCTTGEQPELLRRSLESLVGMDGGDAEIVVVDNRPSRAGTRALVEEFGARAPVRYVRESRPGLAIARNAGLAATGGVDFVAFTDDDAVVDPDWLSWLLAPFRHPEVQAVTGLVMPLRLESEAEKRFERYAGFGKGVAGATYDAGGYAARDRFLFPYWGGMFGSGNSMAFRRETLIARGGFDPALGAGTPTAGGEDIAAFTDVILAGGRLVYEPRSICWHQHRGTEEALRAQVRNYGIGLTAVLWKYWTSDWRFSVTVARSVPGLLGLVRSRREDRALERLPSDLAALEGRGRLLGPWRYVSSRRRARRAGVPAPTGREHRTQGDQAGFQTRT